MKTKFLYLIFVQLLCFNLSLFGQNLNWVRQTGSVFGDNTIGLTTDNELNIYSATNFLGSVTLTSGQTFSSTGKEDFLVKKYSPNGILQWARKFGGKESDFINQITADINNNTYLTGTFQDTLRLFDQLILTSPIPTASVGFIIKLNQNGDMVWAKSLQANSIANPVKAIADSNGDVFVCGNFDGHVDFDPGPSQNILLSTGLTDMFFLKLTSNGNFIWVKKIGGSDSESVLDFELDNNGNIISVGQFNQIVDFDPGSGEFFTDHNGGSDIFIHKLSSNGLFLYAAGLGGVGFDAALGVDLAPNQDILVVGRFSNSVDFDPASNFSFNLLSEGSWDGFVLRLSNSGDFVWAKKIGATQNDQCSTIDITQNDNIVIGGVFRTTVNFNPNFFPNQFSTSNGGADLFHLVLNKDGSYNSHFTVGGLGNEVINKVKSYSINNIMSVGNFGGIMDFDPSQLTANFTSTGNTDGFLLNVFNCVKPYLPLVVSTSSNVCLNEMFTITLPGAQLNGANQWTWHQNSCIAPSFATGISISGSIIQNTTFYVKGTGGCVLNAECRDILISVFTDSLVNQFFEICEGESITVGTQTYSVSGLYVDTLQSIGGCDSVVFTNLNVISPISTEQSFSICPGEEIVVGTNTYRNNGIFIDTLMSINGCDSIIHTEIVVIPIEIITQDIDLCTGEFIIVEDSVYNETGTYINTFNTPEGCENFIITNLTVHPLEYNITHNLCFGDTLRIGNEFYTTSIIVVEFLGSSFGCDSIVNHTINFYHNSLDNNNLFLCAGDSIIVGNNVYKESGLYIDSLYNVAGCDSIIQSNIVFFDTPDPRVFNYTICEGQSVLLNGKTYFAPGTYMDTLQTSFGCDSVLIVHINVLPTFTQNLITICSGDSIKFGTEFLKNQGIYSKIFVSSLGCDSTSVIVLTVTNVIKEFTSRTICIGDNIVVGNSTYSMAGVYLDTLLSSRGCDSIIETRLMTEPDKFNQAFQICQGQQVVIGENVYSSSGIYVDSLTSIRGCDSIVTTNLIVHPKDFIIQSFSLCSGKNIKVGSNTYTQSGIYTDNLFNQFGCDSIVETRLTVIPAPTLNLEKNLCNGESFSIGNFTFSMPGLFEVFLTKPGLCDTLLKLKINVLSADKTIQRIGETLSVSQTSGATYQWFACDRDTIAISGANAAVFIPSQNGHYLVKIQLGQCEFISTCFEYIKTNNLEALDLPIRIYPNPFGESFSIVHNEVETLSVDILNTMSHVISKIKLFKGSNTVDLSMHPSGLYFLKVTYQNRTSIVPIIKK
ncbi:MAG: T9SS type A sorting domain-containing protein [Saprospiraceae bacterium]